MGTELLYPGSTIGVIGNEESGAQLVTIARESGYIVGAYGENKESPMLDLADFKVVGKHDDLNALKEFAQKCDIVTYVSGDIDPNIITYLQRYTKIPQGTKLLELSSDKVLEKAFFESLGFNILPYKTVVAKEDISAASKHIPYPSSLVPIQSSLFHNYFQLNSEEDIAKVKKHLGKYPYILTPSLSTGQVYVANITKSQKNKVESFPLVEAYYSSSHELQLGFTAIDNLSSSLKSEMEKIITVITNKVEYVGSFSISFLVKNNVLYVIDITPGLSKTGYGFSLGTNVNEFQQHLRAITGQLLASPKVASIVMMRTFYGRDVKRIKKALKQRANWNFYYYTNRPAKIKDNQQAGYILIPTPSVEKALDELKELDK